MKNYLFLHGAWHGSWCWNKTTSLLKKQDINCITPDLKIEKEMQNWSDYIELVLKHINNKPVTIIAHSMSGVIASLIAENYPNLVEKIIYISAFALNNNESIMKYVKEDTKIDLSKLVTYINNNVSKINKDLAGEKFYNLCKEDEVKFAIERLREQNIRVFKQKVTLSNNFANTPKYYIVCNNDNIISSEIQLKMANNVKCDKIFNLESDHSPFFSCSEKLVNTISKAP